MGSSCENILKQSFGGVYSNELLAEGGNLYSERPEPFSYISVEVGVCIGVFTCSSLSTSMFVVCLGLCGRGGGADLTSQSACSWLCGFHPPPCARSASLSLSRLLFLDRARDDGQGNEVARWF